MISITDGLMDWVHCMALRDSLYTLVQTLAVPVLFARLWQRGRRNPDYRLRWAERLGRVPTPSVPEGPVVWVHAVSVGEALAAHSLIQALRPHWPGVQFLVTTTTPTGSALVQQWSPQVLHQYLPFDVPALLKPLFQHYQPVALLLMETELWPNVVAMAQARQVPVVLCNARLSERSARGYRRLGRLIQPTFARLDAVLAQTVADAERFSRCGVRSEALQVVGNLKMDSALSAAEQAQWAESRVLLGSRPVWIAGSIHAEEEPVVWAALAQTLAELPELCVIWAPRHSERFVPVFEQLTAQGYAVTRRSQNEPPPRSGGVWLLDTLGELKGCYGLAQVALVGGSWGNTGGHNPIEPARLGVPVLMGPSRFNFRAASDALEHAGALREASAAEVPQRLLDWLTHSAARKQASLAAQAVVRDNQGATARQVAALCQRLTSLTQDASA